MGFDLGRALGGAVGGFFSGGGVPGAIFGGLAGGFSGGGSSTKVETEKRQATPITVIINGKPVTMYAYGPSTRTTKTSGDSGGALGALGDVLTAGGALRKQMQDSGLSLDLPGAPGAPAAAAVESGPAALPVTIPAGILSPTNANTSYWMNNPLLGR